VNGSNALKICSACYQLISLQRKRIIQLARQHQRQRSASALAKYGAGQLSWMLKIAMAANSCESESNSALSARKALA
jgi:hypothetical protein